jgi:aerobic carbon-monoxide dehydrogenase small subunit
LYLGGRKLREFQLKVNGSPYSVTCPPAKTLLDVLRDDLQLTASKECCGKGECGSCSVLLNGEVTCSCLILVGQVENQEITTCEGVGLTTNMDIVQESFITEGATQCGYCTPGIIVASKAFLNEIDYVPTVEEIKTALGGNLCRCTGYTKIIQAIQTAAKEEYEKRPNSVTT